LQEPNTTSANKTIVVRINQVQAVSFSMLFAGVVALVVSFCYSSSVLALAGLSLMFWGGLLLYIRPEEQARKTLISAALLPSLVTLEQMLEELNFSGDAVYLPPKYFENPEDTRVYVAKRKVASLPTPEQTQKAGDRLFIKENSGILLKPPGAELARMFEKTLGKSFTRVDLEYLQQNLPKLFIEDLEIAENLRIETSPEEGATRHPDSSTPAGADVGTVHVRITDPVCREICRESSRLVQVCSKIGCPVCSSIACALTKATGEAVMMESAQFSKDGKTVEVTYRILRPSL
jgi:hypothetical protein